MLTEDEKRGISCDLRDLADSAIEAARKIRHDSTPPIQVRGLVALVVNEAKEIQQKVVDEIID